MSKPEENTDTAAVKAPEYLRAADLLIELGMPNMADAIAMTRDGVFKNGKRIGDIPE